MMSLFWILVGFVPAFLLSYGHNRGWWKKLFKSSSEVPWATVRSFKALSMDHGHSVLMFVSRHDIAESGLSCPRCQTIVAERGDFTGVRRALVNGVENEVIKCPGRVVVDDQEMPCPEWLAASPDTEHGDHLGPDGKVSSDPMHDEPEFLRFKRITPEQALKEKYGMDVIPNDDGSGMEIAPATIVPIEKTNKHDVLAGEELLKAIQVELVKQDQERVLAAEAPAIHDPDATPITGSTITKDPHV